MRLKHICWGIGIVLLVASVAYIGMGVHFVFEAERFSSKVLFRLADNVLDIHCIPYEYLDEKYTAAVTEEQYMNAKTPEEILNIYEVFNSIEYELEATTPITTNGFRTTPQGVVEINGIKYRLRHYIDFTVTHFNFKTKVVKWCVSIRLEE